MNKNALFTLTYGLYLIGIEDNAKLNGCIINTAIQVTDVTPRVIVTLEKSHLTTKLIQNKKSFTISVLEKNVSGDLIANFGFQTGIDKDKFENAKYTLDENGNPYLKECVSYFSCDVEQIIDVDTHILFIASIKNCEIVNNVPPLMYSEYHQRKNNPKSTVMVPSVKVSVAIEDDTKEKIVSKTGFKCTVCNYVFEGETLPDGYICPVCHQPVSAFVPNE